MNKRNLYCAVAVVFIWAVFGMSGFSSASHQMEKADFIPKNCTSDDQCKNVCFTGEFLYSRCDPNGACICDCSDPSQIPSAYTTACEGKQPEGFWRDRCDSYCTQEYLRPCRFCAESKENVICTCVCTKSKANK